MPEACHKIARLSNHRQITFVYCLGLSLVGNTSKKNCAYVRACVYLSAETPQAAKQFPVTADRG